MRRLIITLLAVGWLSMFPHVESMAARQEFPQPRTGFSADMDMRVEAEGSGQPYKLKGKIYYSKGKERREISSFGRKTVTITSRGDKETLILMPEQKMYMKSQDTQRRKDPEAMVRDGEMTITKEGPEKINDRDTIRYRLESAQKDNQSFSGHAWFTKENIPVRFKGIAIGNGMRQNVEINYFKIVTGSQDPGLFKTPKDYRPVPTGMGGMGGGPKGMSPEQLEKLKEMFKNQKRQ